MDPRSGVKDYVRLPVFHLSSRPKWRELCCVRYDVICAGNENGKPVFLCIGSTVFHARGENTIAAFPSRGRCPEGADGALAV